MEYIIHILIITTIYVILSTSLNLIIGYTGLLSIAHAAFYGVGAYVVALMAMKLNSPFIVNFICALFLGGLFGVLIGFSSLRTRDDYFVIATFSFQILVFSILNNWISFTGGPIGIPGIPQPKIFQFKISSHMDFLILALVICSFSLLIVNQIAKSPFGRVLKAIREDEVFAMAMGKNIAMYKIIVFTLGAGMAAAAGAMYAYYISFIDPSSFTVMESIFIISIIIIGGAGSMWGPVFGAILLVILPELLRFVGCPSSIAANIRQIIYGSVLVALMMWRPQGLLGEYALQSEDNKK